MGNCPYCNTEGTVFEGETIKRCLRCLKDIPKDEDDWND